MTQWGLKGTQMDETHGGTLLKKNNLTRENEPTN